MRRALVMFVVACGGAKRATPTSAVPSDAAPAVSSDASEAAPAAPPPVPPAPAKPVARHANPSCMVVRAARDACIARGPEYEYTADVLFGCSGVRSDKSATQRQAERLAHPCICVTPKENDERLQRCMNMP